LQKESAYGSFEIAGLNSLFHSNSDTIMLL